MAIKRIKLAWKDEDGNISEELLEVGETYINYDEEAFYREILTDVQILE